MLWRETASTWAPPERLTASEWADRHAFLSAESAAEPGKWRTLSYQRAILDAFTEPAVEEIVVKKSSRVGYTKVLDNLIGYCIAQDPCSVLVVQPTGDDAKGFAKDELEPMLRDTPVLAALVPTERSRDSKSTIAKKVYPGGILNLVGAHSPRGFRRLTCRVVMFDEVDGYPPFAGKEGDQIALGKRRAQDFYNRKIVLGSSPTISGSSKIEAAFASSCRGYYLVPCPDCGERAVRKFRQDAHARIGGRSLPVSWIAWENDDPRTARWVCPHCGALIGYEHHRAQVDAGHWEGEGWRWTREGGFEFAPDFSGRIGFEIWAGYSFSPNTTPAKIVREFLDAKRTPEELQTFVNTILGETWEERTSGLDAVALSETAGGYGLGDVPAEVGVLTAGVDTQGDRLELQVVGWTWNGVLVPVVVDYLAIPGDPDDDATWSALAEALDREYLHPSGAVLKPRVTAVDSGGHHTQRVYAFARAHRNRGVIAIKGASTSNGPTLKGKPSKVDFKTDGKTFKRGAEVWMVHPDPAKSWLHGRLKAAAGGLVRFPTGLPEAYFRQLTAEAWDAKARRWVKTGASKRNEALDTLVYALAAACHPLLRLDVLNDKQWARLVAKLRPAPAREQPVELEQPITGPAAPPLPTTAPARPKWITPAGPRRGFVNSW